MGRARYPQVERPRERKPPWLRVRVSPSPIYDETRAIVRRHKLNTVCEEANCPNVRECWAKRHATVMILGDVCTRTCSFCNIATGKPRSVDAGEPERLAEAVAELGLEHVVITSVDRDDLPDGGAGQFAHCIEALRAATPKTTVEVLTPDFLRKDGALETVVAARPDVYNHNVETVPRLYHEVRPAADYRHSMALLARVRRLDPSIFTKSGIMVGLGESEGEVLGVMEDLRASDVDFLTIGQYLQPTLGHIGVDRYVTPEDFAAFKRAGDARGFLLVASSPLTRSSHHAGDDFRRLRAARELQAATA